jgi:hypothetical protein
MKVEALQQGAEGKNSGFCELSLRCGPAGLSAMLDPSAAHGLV